MKYFLLINCVVMDMRFLGKARFIQVQGKSLAHKWDRFFTRHKNGCARSCIYELILLL
jgi:hypothetical protein